MPVNCQEKWPVSSLAKQTTTYVRIMGGGGGWGCAGMRPAQLHCFKFSDLSRGGGLMGGSFPWIVAGL